VTGDGRVVLVAGGAGGMGRAVARRFAPRSAAVVLADLDRAGLESAAAEVRALPGAAAEVRTVVADVRRPADCRAAVEAAAALGRLDVLVNAAGVWVEGPAEAATEEEWDRTVGVNLKGPYFLCAAAIPHLERTQGVIVNVASDAGLVGNAGAAIYSASKGGLVLLTRTLALELAPRGIRVNAVCPGDTDTPMLAFQAARYGGGDPEGYLENLRRKYPQRERARFARPDEIAEAIHYLASPAAAPVTGAALPIDFGISAGY
jgi:NAD(P)-dependent dehydrogenase (short-subunit alcohol dehydrogenase family)